MQLGPHHLRKRTRLSGARMRTIGRVATIDTLAYAASFLSLFFSLDQARIIWFQHSAAGVSLLMWIFYTLSSVVWYIYGRIHKDRILRVTNLIWILVCLIVLTGILLYR